MQLEGFLLMYMMIYTASVLDFKLNFSPSAEKYDDNLPVL